MSSFFEDGASTPPLPHLPFRELHELAEKTVDSAVAHPSASSGRENNTTNPHGAGCTCTLDDLEAAVRIFECPLSNTAQLGGELCGLFFEGGGVHCLTRALKYLSDRACGAAGAGVREKCVFLAKRIAVVVSSHLTFSQCVKGGVGAVGGLLNAMAAFVKDVFRGEEEGGEIQRLFLSEDDYTVLSTLASRAANAPGDAWGIVSQGAEGLDLPVTWERAANTLMGLLESALEATHRLQQRGTNAPSQQQPLSAPSA